MDIPILSQIEKLINEHGSAKILGERIALAKDEYAAIEKKLADSEARAKSAELKASNLETERKRLELELQQLKEKNEGRLRFKYGVFWSHDGTPHCNRCKSPITNLGWATYFNRQIRALYCHCAKDPIILMEKGEPIHAPDAMKLMASDAA
jgi:hypothetical protein